MKRRKFIQLSTTASALALMPFEMKAIMESEAVKNCDFSKRRLVIINLDGGNDGLNTVIPINQYDIYSNLRPTIKVPNSGVNSYIQLDSGLAENQQVGLHPALTDFKSLYDEGRMRIFQSVGYPNQNKSHFASSDNYMTGNDGNGFGNGKDSGWMGRFMEQMYADELGSDYPFAVQIGSLKNSLGFHGIQEHGMNINLTNQDPSGFYSIINGLAGEAPQNIPTGTDYGVELDYIVEADKLANIYANAISNSFNAGNNSVTYPDTGLANQLKTVARLIEGGLDSKIYMVRLGGFDTHNNQAETGSIEGRHNDLMKELSPAVGAFMADIKALGIDDDITAITYSEFGRKAAENGNNGTDHGEIAPMFVFGKAIEGGVSGTNPDLTEASEVNNWQIETFQYDYRAVFGTLLKEYMGADDQVIDETFMDHTNTESFNGRVLDELVKSEYKINEACSVGVREELVLDNGGINWFASPNPFVDSITFRNDNDVDKVMVQVFNQNGQLVKASNMNYINGRIQMDLSSLSRGIYTVKLTADNTLTESLKIIKR